MTKFICVTCGVQYGESQYPPSRCLICADERQWINQQGQQWTTIDEMANNHSNRFAEQEPGLIAIRTEPHFAIGQQAYLLQTASGNILWDCISYLDEKTIQTINELGGLSAIAISHPHFYSSMASWSAAFNNIPIYLHNDDRTFVMDPQAQIHYWKGPKKKLHDSIEMIHCGGHFDGSSALHWPQGASNKGVLLSSDTIMVSLDTRYVSFMYSYPNFIPLGFTAIKKILQMVEPYLFDRLYSSWPDRICKTKAKEAISLSAKRYFLQISK